VQTSLTAARLVTKLDHMPVTDTVFKLCIEVSCHAAWNEESSVKKR